MTADDPLTGAEILHWISLGSPDGWSWPLRLDPWDLVDALASALAAVLDVHDPDEVGMCNGCWWESGRDVTPIEECEVRKAIIAALEATQ